MFHLPALPNFVRTNARPILAGAVTMTAWFVLSSRLLLLSQSYTVYSGLSGGAVTGLCIAGRWDDGLESGFVSGLLATPATVALLVAYDIALTEKYDIWLVNTGDYSAAPQTLYGKLFLYGTYEALLGFYPFIVFLVGGIIGGLGGSLLGGAIRSYITSGTRRSERSTSDDGRS